VCVFIGREQLVLYWGRYIQSGSTWWRFWKRKECKLERSKLWLCCHVVVGKEKTSAVDVE